MSRKPLFLFLVPTLIIVLAIAASAQAPPAATSDSPSGSAILTNADILKMVAAKLGDEVIIGKIKNSPGNFDTSIDAVLKLKAAGASDAVIHAMVEASPAAKAVVKEETAKEPAPDPNDPKSPHEPGIYLYLEKSSVTKMVMLEPTVYSQGKSGGLFKTAMTYGIAKAKWKAVVHNPHATIRTSNPGAVFYFYVEEKGVFGGSVSPNEFTLVRFDVKGDSREATVMQMNAFGGSSGTEEKANISFTSVKIRPGVYKITADAPLKPGEYAFLTASGMGAFAPGAAAASRLFDFGLNPPE